MPGADQTVETDSATQVDGKRKPHRSFRITRGSAVLAALLVLVALLGVTHIVRYSAFSPYDEIQHFDTLEKNSRLVLVGQGERLSQTTMREAACHGNDFGWNLGSCDAPTYSPSDFPWEGWNTAVTASPLYYGVTGAAGRFVDFAVPAIDSLLTASRLIGLLWALLAVGLTWLLLGEFSVAYGVRFFIIVLLATAPTVLHLFSIVNPDVTGIAGGAAIAWLTVRWERGASPAWLLVVVAMLTVLGKPLNAAVVGAMVVYLVIRYFQERYATDAVHADFPARGVVALIGGVLLGAVPWLMVQGALATEPVSQVPQIQQFSGREMTLADITTQFTALVSPLRDPYLPAFIAGPLTVLVAAASNIFLLGSNVGVVMLSHNRRASALAGAALTVALLLGPAVAIFMYVGQAGVVFPTTVRYGLPLLPLFAVGIGVAVAEKTWGRVALGILSLSSLAVITAEMTGVM